MPTRSVPRHRALGRVIGVGLVLGWAVLALVVGSSSYRLVAADRVPARVLSCEYKSCIVAWSDGAEHGVTDTDVIARPGDVVTVLHLPGGDGVTGQSSAILAVAVGSPFVLLPVLLVLLLRRSAARRRQLPAD